MTEARTPDLRVISLGAGVQSTTLILMAARGEFDVMPDCAIFADTQWEPKAVYEHLDWLEREVGHIIMLWLQRNGYPVPMKSACIGCPFHDDRYWRDMRDNRPEEWADAVDFDRQIRTGLRGVLHEAYLHRSLVPLDQVDLSTDRDYGQPNLFEMECEGMCGV